LGLRVLSLFDGMSCGQLALQRLGIEVDTYYASEIDKYAIQVTQANFPDTKQLGDVTQLNPKDFKDIDLILAGSPCQGFSFAGKQLAFDDPRSALFFEFIRILKEVKPKYFLLENVRMKQQFQDVITEQVSACYPDHEGNDLFDSKIEPILINSASLSAQSRQRLYWTNIPNVKQPEDLGIVLKDILEDEVEKHYLAGKNLLENYQGGNQLNPNYKSQANTIHDKNKKSGAICAGTHGYANGYVETKPIKVGMNSENLSWRKLTPLEVERLQTVPDNYTNHVSNTQRYKMLGNSFTVEVIAHILNNMKLYCQ
jgi:DNA-cytosine methyltransferase